MRIFFLSLVSFFLVLFLFRENLSGSTTHPPSRINKEKYKDPLVKTFLERKIWEGSHVSLRRNKAPTNEERLWDTFEKESFKHYEEERSPFANKNRLKVLLKKNPELETLAEESLLNLKELFEHHRKNQAYMRVLALDIIREKVRSDASYPLTSIIQKLLKNWECNKAYPGSGEDLMDLLMQWVEKEGKDKIYENPRLLFQSFEYRGEHRKIFSRALANLFPDILPNSKEAREILKLLEGLE